METMHNNTNPTTTTEAWKALAAEATEAARTEDTDWNDGRASAWEDASIIARHHSGAELATRLRDSRARCEKLAEATTDANELDWLDGRSGTFAAAAARTERP